MDLSEYIVDYGALVHFNCGKLIRNWSQRDMMELDDLVDAAERHVCAEE